MAIRRRKHGDSYTCMHAFCNAEKLAVLDRAKTFTLSAFKSDSPNRFQAIKNANIRTGRRLTKLENLSESCFVAFRCKLTFCVYVLA